MITINKEMTRVIRHHDITGVILLEVDKHVNETVDIDVQYEIYKKVWLPVINVVWDQIRSNVYDNNN